MSREAADIKQLAVMVHDLALANKSMLRRIHENKIRIDNVTHALETLVVELMGRNSEGEGH